MCRDFESADDRRIKPRISNPFAVVVRGVDVSGRAFQSETVLDNLSAGGLYVRLEREVSISSRLFIVIRFTARLRVALSGVVLRKEPLGDGRSGVAVRIGRYRFLYELLEPASEG
jgi:hypothetical protein